MGAGVLYQIQVQTGTEIVVPSGAEQEKVSATLGPALASDVLAQSHVILNPALRDTQLLYFDVGKLASSP